MDLTFQVPMQYCSLQHWTLLPSPVASTAGCCFCFGSIPSFFLELFLHWSLSRSILGPYWPGEFLCQCPVFLPFHTVHGVLKARKTCLSQFKHMTSSFCLKSYKIKWYLKRYTGCRVGIWVCSDAKRWCCESAALNMSANLENSAVATGQEKVSLHSSTKERKCQRILKLPHNCTHLTC